ncbi:MAG: hypothetical protein HYY66_01935, partial [Candidatus Tectomicrobia bacterium]|nr:hypothetical protein [Candidatus Tectomicrobia bacterium]
LPSQASLIPLCTVFSDRKHITGEEEKLLQKWFLIANSFSRYSGAMETTLNQDLTALGPKCEGIHALYEILLRDLRAEPKVTVQDLERAGTNSPFFPLAFLAVIRRGAKDWFKGVQVHKDGFNEDQNIEYHHIFPRKHLNARNVDRFLRDEMANIAFLGQKANRRILARKPKDYLEDIAESAPERLKDQFVPMDRGLWELDRYNDFLVARRGMLADAMNEVLKG